MGANKYNVHTHKCVECGVDSECDLIQEECYVEQFGIMVVCDKCWKKREVE